MGRGTDKMGKARYVSRTGEFTMERVTGLYGEFTCVFRGM